MASKIKLDEGYYLEDSKVIFEDKQANTANVIFNAQQVHAIELLVGYFQSQKAIKTSQLAKDSLSDTLYDLFNGDTSIY